MICIIQVRIQISQRVRIQILSKDIYENGLGRTFCISRRLLRFGCLFFGIFYIRILIEELVGTSEDGTAGTYNVSNNRIAVFRSSNEFLYEDPDIEDTEEQTTETEQPSTDTEGSTQTTEKSTEQSSEQSLSGAGTATDQSVEHTVNTPLTQN